MLAKKNPTWVNSDVVQIKGLLRTIKALGHTLLKVFTKKEKKTH